VRHRHAGVGECQGILVPSTDAFERSRNRRQSYR
jgi:hypothetical protein